LLGFFFVAPGQYESLPLGPIIVIGVNYLYSSKNLFVHGDRSCKR